MAEVGIDIAAEKPKILTDQAVRESDVVITMGCGDTCPFYPGKRYEDWVLDDPAGKDVEAVRPIRDEIRRRVEALLDDLVPAARARDRSGSSRNQTGAAPIAGGSARRRGNQSGQRVQGVGHELVVGPLPALFTGQDAGFDQQPEMV